MNVDKGTCYERQKITHAVAGFCAGHAVCAEPGADTAERRLLRSGHTAVPLAGGGCRTLFCTVYHQRTLSPRTATATSSAVVVAVTDKSLDAYFRHSGHLCHVVHAGGGDVSALRIGRTGHYSQLCCLIADNAAGQSAQRKARAEND